MELTESQGMYLRTILTLLMQQEKVLMVDVARHLGFSKPSASVMLKNLRLDGYILSDEHKGLSLTPKGLLAAKKLYERYELIAALLMHLGVQSDIAYQDACKLEHDLSDEAFEKLKHHYISLL